MDEYTRTLIVAYLAWWIAKMTPTFPEHRKRKPNWPCDCRQCDIRKARARAARIDGRIGDGD